MSDPSPKSPVGTENSVPEEADEDTRKTPSKASRPRDVDDDTDFWSTYVLEAGESDRKLLETWNQTLDSLLTFAALFSAINVSFIIESYKQLQPDPMEVTNTLLRFLVQHRNDDLPLPEEEPGPAGWNASASAFRINCTLFSSLACSLLASFGAVSGKEMLAEYSNSVALPAGASPEQARRRHRKYRGLKAFQFRWLMQLLPVLLQLSLALFLVGIIDFMWLQSQAVAKVFMAQVILGLAAYIISLMIALCFEDSPFQTSLSTFLRSLYRSLTYFESRPWFTKRGKGDRESAETWSLPKNTAPSNFHPLLSWLRAIPRLFAWFQRKLEIQISKFTHTRLGMKSLNGVRAIWDNIRQSFHFEDWLEGKGIHVGHGHKAVESTDCVVWILKRGNDTTNLRKALRTFPLLPADILLEKQRGRFEPHASIYSSSLNRRPGDVDFRWNDPRNYGGISDAIIAGTALFHVLKSREDNDPSYTQLALQVDPDLIDDIDLDADVGQIDLCLMTVVLCVQTQMRVTKWTMELLKRLLERYLNLISPSVVISKELSPEKRFSQSVLRGNTLSPTNRYFSLDHDRAFRSESRPSTTHELMPPAITLLLDAVIYSISHKPQDDSYYSVCRRFPKSCERILELLRAILEVGPYSMTLTSHVAIAITVIQWYKCKDRFPDHDEFNGIRSDVIRSSWLAVDKRAAFFPNITQAFTMISSLRISESNSPQESTTGDSDATLRLYAKLLDITEQFMPKAMEVSEKSDRWREWWTNAVRIIPCLLRFVDQIHGKDVQAAHKALIVISRLLPDDWTMQRTFLRVHESEMPEGLESLSPLDQEHGKTLSKLISSVLASESKTPAREAAAEILRWTILYPDVEEKLPTLIDGHETGEMYEQIVGVPTFLISMWKKPHAMNLNLQSLDDGYFEKYFSLLFGMVVERGSRASRVQLEAVVAALANASRFRYWSILPRANFNKYVPEDDNDQTAAKVLLKLLNRISELNPDLKRPPSFVDVTPALALDSSKGLPLTITEWRPEFAVTDERLVFGDEEISKIWCGEWLMFIWQIVSKTSEDRKNRTYFYQEEVVDTVIDSFFKLREFENTKWKSLDRSYSIASHYLKEIPSNTKLSATLRDQIQPAITFLDTGETT